MNAFPRLKAYFHIAVALIVIGYPMYLWALWDPMDYGFSAMRLGGDFFAFYEAALLSLRGYVMLVMDFPEFRLTALEYAPGSHPFYEWVMSPGLLLFLLPFAVVPFTFSYILFFLAGIGALVTACKERYRSFDTLDFVCLAPASLLCVLYGQPVIFVAALLCAGLRHLPLSPVYAGLLLGVTVIEPFVFGFSLLALAASRNMMALSAAICSAAGVVFLSTVLFGAESWSLYWQTAFSTQFSALLQADNPVISMAVSVTGSLIAMALNKESVVLVQSLVTVLAACVVVWLFWRERDREARDLVFVICIVLANPFTYVWDLALVTPLLYFYAVRHEVFAPSDYDSPVFEPIALTALYLLPFAAIALTSHLVPIAPLVLVVAVFFVIPRLVAPVEEAGQRSGHDAGLTA
ncbi:glycosyltransferase family 87 protein [Pseudovibrio sp. SPO723]|uniref:glycosyltransferase family 87 protein n=1 Tax=Nesiotobacter zosterae TaxID=392721 RepID=UPI0029C1A9ED|nr:glycosyltransferase family 87 protein [Pseudovibrio sp. SPO723]MDX5594045.1 glycosyltransferase family 87 protein [Pseudovibrio sp. SPO723]